MKFLFALLALSMVTACADSGAGYRPILDGTPTETYQADLAACQALAKSQKQFDQEAIGAVAIGAGTGAILGEVDDNDALGGAIVGAIAGGAAGAVNASDRREAIVIECLRGRGHRVVG